MDARPDLLTTAEAARRLGVPYHRLYGVVRRGRIPRPARSSAWYYGWSAADLDAARLALGAARTGKTAPPN